VPGLDDEAAAHRATDLVRGTLHRAQLGATGHSNPLSEGDPTAWLNQLLDLAEDLYREHAPTADLVKFSHGTADYLFDVAGDPQVERTILALGRPEAPTQAREVTYQRGYPLPQVVANRAVDRGHFIPYTSGGLYGPNLFVQDRALNRGWSEQGRQYRKLEQLAVAGAPGSSVFILPHYIDQTDVPGFLTLGAVTPDGFAVDTFRNRYDEPETLSLGTHLSGATDAQIGALGEETASILVEEDLAGTIVAMGDAGLPRSEGRQDLDLLAIIEGTLTAVEVKTRYLSRQAGRLTRGGNLLRPRMRRAASAGGTRQGSQKYVTARLAGSIDTGEDAYDGIDVQVIAIDFRLMLAQQFDLNDAGTRLTPRGGPMDCRRACERALDRVLAHRGFP
jgi:hypothetical protein